MAEDDRADLITGFTWAEPPGEGDSPAERLLRQFERHETHEQETLQEYRDAISVTENPIVRFFLRLIQLDEEKHRELIGAMKSTFEKGLFWTQAEAPLDPTRRVGPERETLLPMVKEFIRVERVGIKEFKQLLGDTQNLYGGAFDALLRALIMDSEKHVMFLRFVHGYLKKAGRP